MGISAFFALERCLQRRSKDTTALHLASLISERLGLSSKAVTFARRSAKLLEAAYERSEDSRIARQYAITQSTLGRILLSEGSYNEACESFDIVLSLVDKAEDPNTADREAIQLRSQAYFASGLAKLLSGEVETAISDFETAVEETPVSFSFLRTQATILLAQTMWMLGTEEAQEAAKALLLERYETCSLLASLGLNISMTRIASEQTLRMSTPWLFWEPLRLFWEMKRYWTPLCRR